MDRLKELTEVLKQIESSRAQKHFELNKKRQEGKLSVYELKEQLKIIDTAHNELKEKTRREYQLYRDTYRKELALQLNAPTDTSPESETLWRKAIEKVNSAKSHEQITALVREASTWKDVNLAKALVYAHAGSRDTEYIHAALLGQDAVIDELYNFEKEHAGYRNPHEIPPPSTNRLMGSQAPRMSLVQMGYQDDYTVSTLNGDDKMKKNKDEKKKKDEQPKPPKREPKKSSYFDIFRKSKG